MYTALRSAAGRVRAVIVECNDAQRRLAERQSSTDSYLLTPDRAR